MVVLSKKSWHYWVYRQFFSGYFSKDPNNLCPYFWKVVLCIVIFPISAILALPAIMCKAAIDSDEIDPLGENVGIGLSIWAAMGFLITMIAMFFTKNQVIHTIGWMGWGILAFVAVILIGSVAVEATKEKRTLMGEFMEAKKNKYCPKIQWKKNEGTEVL